MVNCLTKKKHYIPYIIDKNGTTTEVIAQLLLLNIWKLYGFLSSLTANRGVPFISGVWKNLCKTLGISTSLSASFHLETDG